MAGTPRNAKGEFLSPEEQHTFLGSFNHADERFPNLKGARRWKAILRVYGKSTNATLKVLKFDSETSKYKRLLVRSKFNNRRQDQVVRQYAKSILSGGAVEHCRGQLIAVEVEGQEGGDCPTYEMLGGASLCEAIEVAAEMHSSNEFVQDVAESGLSNVIVLMAGTPPDVQRWIKTEHNNYHSGSDTNIVEMYMYVEAAEEGWKNHKKVEGITVASCPKTGDFRYEKLYERFVLQHYPFYKRWPLLHVTFVLFLLWWAALGVLTASLSLSVCRYLSLPVSWSVRVSICLPLSVHLSVLPSVPRCLPHCLPLCLSLSPLLSMHRLHQLSVALLHVSVRLNIRLHFYMSVDASIIISLGGTCLTPSRAAITSCRTSRFGASTRTFCRPSASSSRSPSTLSLPPS